MAGVFKSIKATLTRINTGILPQELPTKLLLSELHGIVRIPRTIQSGRAKVTDIPPKFTLNKGHVKFFYNKGGYTLSRYKSLRVEALKRGCVVQDFSGGWDNLPPHLMNNYEETEQDRELLIQRINERGFALNKINQSIKL